MPRKVRRKFRGKRVRGRRSHAYAARRCPLCGKPADNRCGYCNGSFCDYHSTPRGKIDEAKNARLVREYDPTMGHACYEYKIRSKGEEADREKRYYDALDNMKRMGSAGSDARPARPRNQSGHQTRGRPLNIRLPRMRIPRLNRNRHLRNPISWYVIYALAIVGLDNLASDNLPVYTSLIQYLQYPLYAFSAFLGGYIPYRLFKRFEHWEPGSDLGLWGLNIISGLFAVASVIIMFFGLTFTFTSMLPGIGKEVGYSMSAFFWALFIGIFMLSAYLLFKYRIRSNVITYRHSRW